MLLFFHAAVIYLGFVVEILVFCLFALVSEFNAKDTLNTEKGTQLRSVPYDPKRPFYNAQRVHTMSPVRKHSLP